LRPHDIVTSALGVRSEEVEETIKNERFAKIRYADSERICKVLINESADNAILEADAGRFVTRIDEHSPHWKALKDGLEDLWKEVVVGDGEDEDFGDFGELMALESVEGYEEVWDRGEDDEDEEGFDVLVQDEDVDEVTDVISEEDMGDSDFAMVRLEATAVRLLQQYFPAECSPELGGVVLRGAAHSRYQVPDVMFRGAIAVQPNYAEFIHRDMDTCNPPRDLKAAIPGGKDKFSYRFFNLWVARTALAGQIDAHGQVRSKFAGF